VSARVGGARESGIRADADASDGFGGLDAWRQGPGKVPTIRRLLVLFRVFLILQLLPQFLLLLQLLPQFLILPLLPQFPAHSSAFFAHIAMLIADPSTSGAAVCRRRTPEQGHAEAREVLRIYLLSCAC